jgi:hypothetical protein
MPIAPPPAIEMTLRRARLRKRSSRRSTPVGIAEAAVITKTSESTCSSGPSCGSLSRPAIGPASTTPATVNSVPSSIAAQNAVSMCSRVSCLRWTIASPSPWSTKSVASITKTIASATSPKSSGVSSRAMTTKTASSSSCRPQLSTIVQVTPRATRRCRFWLSEPCSTGSQESVTGIASLSPPEQRV